MGRRLLWVCCAGLAASCGRINFDPEVALRCTPGAAFTEIRRLDELSSNSLDGGLRLRDDELVGYFHTTRSGISEIWTTSRTSRELPFDPPQPLLQAPGTSVFWPTVDAAELTLVYSDAKDLLLSERTSVLEPFPLGQLIAEVDTAFAQSSAFLGRSGTTLYLSHFELEGAIYVAPWPPSEPPRAIGALETGDLEQAPALTADERVIYFARGAATVDIFRAERATLDDAFGPTTLVAELATAANESPTGVSADGCRLYFESDRDGPVQLYVAERIP